MGPHIPETIGVSTFNKDTSRQFYNERMQLYLEIDISDVRLGAGHLQARDGMWFPKYEASDNSVL